MFDPAKVLNWRLIFGSCGCLLIAGLSMGQEPSSPIVVLPKQSFASSPVGAVDVLPVGRLFVIKSKVRCNVYDSPQGLVKLEPLNRDDKPLEGIALCYSQFFDGDGFEKREYGSDDFKFIYLATAIPNVSGNVELIIAPDGSRTPLRRMLSVGGPRPPPEPEPIPPGPPPGPAPITLDGFRVLFVYESEDRLTAKQRSILTSQTIRDYLKLKCVKGMDTVTPEYRFFDKDSNVSRESPHWQQAMARPRTSLPWLIISNGKQGWEGPLPASVDETLAKLKSIGGQ